MRGIHRPSAPWARAPPPSRSDRSAPALARGPLARRLQHKWFLRPAAELKAVKAAFRFVQLLPRRHTDARTYNMVLTVCAEAADLRNALHCADMLQARAGGDVTGGGALFHLYFLLGEGKKGGTWEVVEGRAAH